MEKNSLNVYGQILLTTETTPNLFEIQRNPKYTNISREKSLFGLQSNQFYPQKIGPVY